MDSCTHQNLVLLPEKKKKFRCTHCHLSIDADEIGNSYCPECFEAEGQKRYDFQEIISESAGPVRYRCEECGIQIECDSSV
jgi:hypothetical protein